MLTTTGLTRIFANRYDSIAGGVRDASFTLAAGDFFTLLGPSGCGKTTTLRCLAGLERPDAGRIDLAGQTIFDAEAGTLVPVHRRGIGMVFQSYAVWPHMTVFENVAFPLIRGNRKVARHEVKTRVMKALAMVQLESMADRPAPMLSGGQQQRVALARALVYEPKMLLLDEPLSNLDAKLRVEMRIEIQQIIKRLGLTGLYVTHDQEEAMAISDRIAVMQDGVILQEAAPHHIYADPVTVFVAGFIGKSSFLECVVSDIDAERIKVTSGPITLFCRRRAAPQQLRLGDRLDVMIRPEDILVVDDNPAMGVNVFEAEVGLSTHTGGRCSCLLVVGDRRITADLHGRHLLKPGDRIKVGVHMDHVKAFARSSDSVKQLDPA